MNWKALMEVGLHMNLKVLMEQVLHKSWKELIVLEHRMS